MDEKISSFLKNIEQIESSGGENTNHPEIESGIHTGHSAIGRYGLMPNTIKEIINRERIAGKNQPIYDLLEELDPNELKDFIEQSPELETQLAKSLATRVLGKTGGDEEKAAYAWNMGHNLSPEQIQSRDYKSSPYVQKFQTLNSINEQPDTVSDIKLASKVDAPLPSFANTSGNMPTPGLLEKFATDAIGKGGELLETGLQNYEDASREINDASDPWYHLSGGKMRSPIQIDPMGFQGSIKNIAQKGLTVETPFIKALRDQWDNPQFVDDAAAKADDIGDFGKLTEEVTNPGISPTPTELPPSKAQINQERAVSNAADRLLSPFQKEILNEQSTVKNQLAEEFARKKAQAQTVDAFMNNPPEPTSKLKEIFMEELSQGKSLPPSAEAIVEGNVMSRPKRTPVLKPKPDEPFLSTMGLDKEPVSSQDARLQMIRKLMK